MGSSPFGGAGESLSIIISLWPNTACRQLGSAMSPCGSHGFLQNEANSGEMRSRGPLGSENVFCGTNPSLAFVRSVLQNEPNSGSALPWGPPGTNDTGGSAA